MLLSDAIRKRIKFYQKQKGMSYYAIFKASGVSITTISQFMKNKNKLIQLDTLLHICEAFNITITEFFEEDIFKEVEQDD